MLMDPHPVNSMQVSIMQFDNFNRKYPGSKQGLNLPRPRSLGWMGEQIRRQHILVSRFTCTPHILKYFICEIKFTPRCSWRWCVLRSPTWCPWSSSPWTSWGWTEVRVWAGPILQNYFWSTFYLELVNSDNNHLLSTGIIEQLDSLQHDRLGISNSRNHKQIVTMLQWKRLLLLVKTTSHVTCSIKSECFIAS